jgi:intracellular sulfur oxidation DsrE/DsrF family protein
MTTNKSIAQNKSELYPSTENTGLKRRGFLGTLSAGAVAVGLSILKPLTAAAENVNKFRSPGDPDKWFDQIKGKHRILFDVKEPFASPVLPFVWPRVFLMTNEATGTPEKDCSVVMILRHEAIPYAMDSNLWEKYKLGEVFKINDPTTKSPQTKNPFWKPAPGTFKAPGIGEIKIGINELQADGVLLAVCNAALTVYSAAIAGQMKMPADAVYKEWVAGVLPGIEVVPSGVWAVNRAQEHGCSYCA